MKLFKDNEGRQWQVVVNVASLKRVRDLTKTDLLDVVNGDLIQRLTLDPVLLVDCLFALCKTQADQRNVTDIQFGEGMAGDAIDAATTALLEELVDFFPQPKRSVLAKALMKVRQMETMILQQAEQRLDNGAVEAAVAQAMNSGV